MFFAASDAEQGLRLLAGEERLNALLLVLLDRNAGVLTRLEIGAKYEKDHEFLNAAISVALPVVGMILFTAILLGLPSKSTEVAKLSVIESAANLSVGEEGEKEESLAKAA